MPYRLAITIAGAVSLGSFEAGVLYEVLDALGQHNEASAPGARIHIDVLTGASAGGMTAAIAAQKMLYSAGELADPYDNIFYNAWVAGVDIRGLLPLQPGESANQSFLSSNFVKALAQRFLLGRYSEAPIPAQTPHPALNAAGLIRMGLALSNLNGVDFNRPLLSGGTFNYTRFADQITFAFDKGTDTAEAWTPVANAAVACGAFPFAFRPCQLSRDIKDYPSQFLAQWPVSPRMFCYTDGGVFQNQPIGLAKNLVDGVDKHRDSDTRAYLFVSPEAVDPAVNGITAKAANFKAMTGALFNAVYSQAGFRDWIEAESVNDDVALLNQRADQLLALFKSGKLQTLAIQNVTAFLLAQFHLDESQLQSARTQLRAQFGPEYAELASADPSTADVWLDTILLFELAADLHEKDEMYIYSVTAERKDLAGAGLSSFLGFLDRSFRDHDYDLGREKARSLLTSLHQVSKGQLPQLAYTPKFIHPIVATPPGGFSPKMISKASRKDLAKALAKAIDNILIQEGVAGWLGWLRKTAEILYINHKINDMLDL